MTRYPPGAKAIGFGGRLAALLAALVPLATGCASAPAAGSWDQNGDGVVDVAILGDSNSFAAARDVWSVALRRALRETGAGRWRVRTVARLGATIAERGNPRQGGTFQIERALAKRPPPDVAILAFGTNDLLHGLPPAGIAEAYGRAIVRLEGAGARVLIATTPPCWSPRCDRDRVAELNALLLTRFPARTQVDFSSWVTRADLGSDGLHFTPAGHAKRFRAALDALRAGPPAVPAGAPPAPAPDPT